MSDPTISSYLLQHAFETSPGEAMAFDAGTLRIVLTNRQSRTNLQYDTRELAGMTLADICPDHDIHDLQARLAPLILGQVASIPLTLPHRRKDGTTYEAELADPRPRPAFGRAGTGCRCNGPAIGQTGGTQRRKYANRRRRNIA